MTVEELEDVLADAPLISAPGQDEVSTGVWKLAIKNNDSVRQHVIDLFSQCLATSTFPSAWKTSVIVPLIKDAKKDRTMSNIRPISLQSCLGKLFMKVLAHRLSNIFQQHPILNSAQRGFIQGGTTMKCIDELMDAWGMRSGSGFIGRDCKDGLEVIDHHSLELLSGICKLTIGVDNREDLRGQCIALDHAVNSGCRICIEGRSACASESMLLLS
ncbi:MAG: reverse transcriptase domain-containing protein, partial [Candidatus Pacebacteria bacterium]|nr:reverse transcriptase domain-containing protein [Candidatus Paceibacterota bacterium]